MMHMPLMSVIFRVINGFVLGCVGIYIYSTYIRSMIILYTQERDLVLEGHREQTEALYYQKQRIDEQQKNQHLLYDHLRKNIILWNQALLHERERDQKERDTIRDKIARDVVIRDDSRRIYTYYKEVMPEAMVRIRQELHDYYSCANHAPEYIKKSIENLTTMLYEQ